MYVYMYTHVSHSHGGSYKGLGRNMQQSRGHLLYLQRMNAASGRPCLGMGEPYSMGPHLL